MPNPITPLTPAEEQQSETGAAHESYPERVAVEFDDFINVITGGHPDETISARASRDAVEGKPVGKAISAALNVFQKDHGAHAQAGDLERAEVVAGLEEGNGILPGE